MIERGKRGAEIEEMRSGGWCAACNRSHLLPAGPVLSDCHALMSHLSRVKRIDGLEAPCGDDPRCATRPLFETGGGKMFGLLSCRDDAGKRVVLRAFSGQLNGLWQVAGWVGPIFDVKRFDTLVAEPDRAIKALGQRLQRCEPVSVEYRELKRKRRQLSQELMQAIHALYTLRNFRGESAPLIQVFQGKGMPPAGTGDCCAPKLLHHAACHGLRPEGLVEFYWGTTNHSQTKRHGQLYVACEAKCQPILGFQLCGGVDV
ncbi:hypothetical protein JWJ90_08630 [Desulfobulbus rhabdoformis]|uniref:hypothetical protein n=1 Tax=Desulfobulbus rhabdoformis TaxID=34032 RepID=UPI001963D17B|nr:hypothetical protein [Desulfobulbus rhabdoformis]MBM9614354.1 hypothetical protein [Desulfobulbus rhabdoformis]